MDRLTHTALLVNEGMQIPENAVSIEHCTEDVSFYDENDKYISYYSFDNEYLGQDAYAIEFEGEQQFTVAEFNEWVIANSEALAKFVQDRVLAIQVIAHISANVQQQVQDAIDLSRKYGVPFRLNIDGVEFDTARLHAVDWNSSSMYC